MEYYFWSGPFIISFGLMFIFFFFLKFFLKNTPLIINPIYVWLWVYGQTRWTWFSQWHRRKLENQLPLLCSHDARRTSSIFSQSVLESEWRVLKMTTIRKFCCNDLLRFSSVNLDHLTETVRFPLVERFFWLSVL